MNTAVTKEVHSILFFLTFAVHQLSTELNIHMNLKTAENDAFQLVKQVVVGMQEKKARKIIQLDLTSIPNAVAKYFVICHAPSKTQVDAIYDNVLEFVQKQLAVKPFNREGYENSEWILIDYVDVVVHIFLEDIRTFYQLEDLWADAKLKSYQSDD